MHLDPFELHRPTSLQEAIETYSSTGGKADYLAGGTDLLPNYKMHINLRPHVIALWDIPELSARSDGRLGAMVRLADLERDENFVAGFRGVADALREVATPLVRASGTLGGNLLVETRCFFFNQSYFWRASLGFCLKADGDRCHVVPQKERCYATFSGDLAPPLIALSAQVELAGASGRRILPLDRFYDLEGDGIRRHHLAPGEILVAVLLPPEANSTSGAYLKLRVRPSFDFPELGVAVALRGSRNRIESLRVVVGGVETSPVSFDRLTGPLVGGALSDDRIRLLAESVQNSVRPVHNTFLQPDYRRRMVSVFVRRAIERALARAGGAM